MRTCVLLVLSSALGAQESTTTYTTDLNGQRVAGASYSSSRTDGQSVRTEFTQSINGRQVPLESTTENVVREDSTGKVIERVIRRFDQTGNPGPPEKQRIEFRNNADGSVSSVTTTYRADLNGNFQLAERAIAEASKTGNTVQTQVEVQRASINGGLELEERQVHTATQDTGSSRSDVVTFRKDQAGRFVEALRVVTDSQVQNGQTVQNVAQYEPADTGKLQLASQTVSRVRKNADGSESREVDIYKSVPGRADPANAPRLQERQYVETRQQGDRRVETTVVRRPSISDPNRLGDPQKLGERVCTGKCP